MERKIKYITFPVKKCTEAYEGRICSPFDNPKYKKCTVSVRKVSCKYKKIVSKNCRINDMSKIINSDVLFPMNRSKYANLLIELTENSTRFFHSFSMLSSNNEKSILRFVYYSIRSNYRVIETMLYSEIKKKFLFNFKKQVKILKLNFVTSNEILKVTNNFAKDWKIAHIVEILEKYLGHLRTICTFIYLIIFKKKSRVINRLLPPVSYKSSKLYICGVCYQSEMTCMCFAYKESTSNRNHDLDDNDVDHFSPESVKNLQDENASRFLKSTSYAEIKNSKPDSEESSTDTDSRTNASQ